MSKLGIVEDTLFVPMLGRIYASEHCQQILFDQKALELKEKLPSSLLKAGTAEPVYLAGLRRPILQYGSNRSGLSGAQSGRRDRSTRLRPGDSLLSL